MTLRTLAALLVLAAGSAQAWQTEPALPGFGNAILGPAPWLDPNAPPPAPQAPSVPKAVSAVAAIDTANRAAVVAAYNAYFNVARPAVGFTGSTSTCTPGAISLAFQEWSLTRINFMRAMAGVPGNTTLDTTKNAQEQAAALIMAANSTLNHFPPSGYACWSQAGYDGASTSNLALGTGLTDSIPLYMTDPGTGNEIVGHRRWILHSRKSSFGLGQANGVTYNASALYVFDFSAPAPPLPDGIAWPPRGHVPMALFPAPYGGEGQRWSFGLPGANFAAANVTMTLNGSPLAVTVLSRTDNGYGDNTLVWALPGGHAVAKDTTYNVSITGVSNAGSTSYSYQVLPFDPADPPPPPASNPPRLANLSTRGPVLTGDNVMIGGFVIGGATAKKVLITARGPSLSGFGVPGAMANPTLQLFTGQTGLASNDDWGNAPNVAEIQATGVAPTDALESAILATLNPGAYTAIVAGVGGGTGVGIVEVFEVDQPDTPLINISTRGQVQTGDNVMIGGVIIQGDAPQTVLVTARGPSLSAFGVPGVLANPVLQLYSGQTVIASNDDLGTAPNLAQILATGVAPTNALESAILITLAPGAYTAIVTGAGGTSGVGIVEVFAQ